MALLADLRHFRLCFADAQAVADRHDRLFAVLLVAYCLLSAYGAAAEARGLDQLLKANTVAQRVLSVAAIGYLALQTLKLPIPVAMEHLPREVEI